MQINIKKIFSSVADMMDFLDAMCAEIEEGVQSGEGWEILLDNNNSNGDNRSNTPQPDSGSGEEGEREGGSAPQA